MKVLGVVNNYICSISQVNFWKRGVYESAILKLMWTVH